MLIHLFMIQPIWQITETYTDNLKFYENNKIFTNSLVILCK